MIATTEQFNRMGKVECDNGHRRRKFLTLPCWLGSYALVAVVEREATVIHVGTWSQCEQELCDAARIPDFYSDLRIVRIAEVTLDLSNHK